MLAASKPGFFNIRVTIACSCNTELEADRRALSSDIYSQVRGLRKVDPYSSRSNSRSRKVWIDLAGDFIIITITVEVDCRGPSKSACDGPILYHFRDKARYWLKIVIFLYTTRPMEQLTRNSNISGYKLDTIKRRLGKLGATYKNCKFGIPIVYNIDLTGLGS